MKNRIFTHAPQALAGQLGGHPKPWGGYPKPWGGYTNPSARAVNNDFLLHNYLNFKILQYDKNCRLVA
jgi:hypothetical protein